MNTIGLWQILDSVPRRLQHGEVSLEKDLEDWIERDPSLLERGLVIVGRQIRLEGGPLDLLALDPQGRWVLIEIKRERLRREVIAQAIDYASCLCRLDLARLREQCDDYLRKKGSEDTLEGLLSQRGRNLEAEADGRDVVIYLVGTGIDAGLERMVEFLAERAELALRLVTFSTFRDRQENTLLSREIHESVTELSKKRSTTIAPSLEPEAALALADQNGVGGVLRTLYVTAAELGIHARPFVKNIMFAPSSNRTRCLFVVSVERRQREPGMAKSYISAEAFEQFYGINEADLAAAIKMAPGDVMLDQTKAEQLSAGLRRLLDGRST